MKEPPVDPKTYNRIDPAVIAAINAAITDPLNPESVNLVLHKLAEVLAYEAGIMLAGLVETGNMRESEMPHALEKIFDVMQDGAAVRRKRAERFSLDVFRAMLPKQ